MRTRPITGVFELANRAETRGIFQFDGEGMRKLIKAGGVTRFEDLVAYSALFRPGPLGMKMHERYVERKRGRERWEDQVPECVRDVLSKTYGWPLTPIDSAKSTLTIYEDPQCPYCGQFEAAYGETVAKLSSDGTVNVVYQMAAFLDDNLPQSKKASRRAINALGCAIDQGAGLAYHRLIYASQPQQEGAGWTDEQLLKLGSLSKLEGDALAKFESCAKAGTYLGWSDNATQVFRDNQIPGTPYIELDGKQVPDSALASVTAFVDYVTQNKK